MAAAGARTGWQLRREPSVYTALALCQAWAGKPVPCPAQVFTKSVLTDQWREQGQARRKVCLLCRPALVGLD